MQKKNVFNQVILCSLFLLFFPGGNLIVFGQTGPLLGDVNSDGTVTIVDALMIAQYSVGIIPAGFVAGAADADANGSINIVDALVIAQYYVGLIPTLPPGSKTPTPVPTATARPLATVDNPFVNAVWYINPEWSDQAVAGGGSEIAYYSTGVWMHSIGSITDGIGLRGHMDNALSQGANMILIVLNDIPPWCENWVDPNTGRSLYTRYTTEFIDPVAAILSGTAYRLIRKVIILEPGVLANLITDLDNPSCQAANGPGGYIDAIRYALNRLNTVSNVYNYLDIAYSAWLGWDSNFGPAADLIANCVKGTAAGVNGIAGFASNIAGYVPVEEPFLQDPDLMVNGKPLKSSTFFEWNPYFSELPYAQAMRNAFIERGFPETTGMLIDTSRNGWGGPGRPADVSSSDDLNTYVNESRIDRRLHRNNWCNQPGGIGERPQANPAPGIDAYVWAWPPGISDGISEPGIIDPYNPGLTFDAMCDPNGKNVYNPAFGTGALPAPHRWHWNQAHFDLLVDNAYPPLITRADNPFENARWYVNPDWADLARAGGGAAIANNNTAIWLDRIEAITEGRGLAGHLDKALAQGANLVLLVIYDLPNRNCLQRQPGGDFSVPNDGVNRYKTEFIDPIAAILSNPAYRNIRMAVVVEPFSLANLISSLDSAYCREVYAVNAYTVGIQYALNQFNKIPNVYCYMDMAGSYWLGWDSNFGPAVDIVSRVAKGAAAGANSISGLITNVANYAPLEEPFLPDNSLVIGGKPVRASDFYEYNPCFGEAAYAHDVRNAFIARGFPATIGMLIDTSRNGWGGPERPTAVSTSNDLNTYVDESRVDKRLNRGNWCNQPGGIGERPRADPEPGIDAYVWAWPPGISDGASSPANMDPLDITVNFEPMCDPDGASVYNSAYGTGAMPAPHIRHWNQPHFDLLLRNIYPQL